MSRSRHRWGARTVFQFKTERECLRGCGIVKVTRHEPGQLPWQEFWRGLDKIECEGTPPCEAVAQQQERAA